MDKETMKALNASIKKWEHNCEVIKSGKTIRGFKGRYEDDDETRLRVGKSDLLIGPLDCPLCNLYIFYENGDCSKCPICNFTSFKYCKDTPFSEITKLLESPNGDGQFYTRTITPRMIKAFEEELAFLRRLKRVSHG